MKIDQNISPIEHGPWKLVMGSQFKARKGILKHRKTSEQVQKERARESASLGKKKMGWVGNFWAKIKISDDKIKNGGRSERRRETLDY